MLENIPEIIEALLAILGGCRVISRYTPWKWDDKFFDAAEKPMKKAASLAKRYLKKSDDEPK